MSMREALRELPKAVFADVLESDEAYLLVLDLPGVTADTVDVRVENSRLHIEARRDKTLEPEFRYVKEGRALFLDCELPLPPDGAAAGAEGTVEKGVLELRLPKSDEEGGRTVPIT